MPPPIFITQYLTEEEYVLAYRTEDRSSTKLSATQCKVLLAQGGQNALKVLDGLLADAIYEATTPSTPTTGRKLIGSHCLQKEPFILRGHRYSKVDIMLEYKNTEKRVVLFYGEAYITQAMLRCQKR